MVMPGDTRHIQHVELTFKYSEELSEDEIPRPGRPDPVLAPDSYSRFRKWRIKRVFYFLTSSSALCLAAVTLVPRPAVQATALGIWAASAGLARFLLTGAYLKPNETEVPRD
jgi:hypothetical protein